MIDTPAVFLLIGFAGTGKLTVAEAIKRGLSGAGRQVRVVDNHYLNNPIFGLIEQDGLAALPSEVWERVDEVRKAVIKTIESLSPPSWSFIFTNDLVEGPAERRWVKRLERLAAARGSTFVPVRLLCDLPELSSRVANPERRDRMKSVNVDDLRFRYEHEQVFDPKTPATLTLDITSVAPDQAAASILVHAVALASRPWTPFTSIA